MRVRKLIVLFMLAAVGATACGSSSKTGASKTTSPSGGNTSSSSAPGSNTGGSSGATTSAPKLSGDSGSSFCNLVRGDVSAFGATNFAAASPTDLKQRYQHLGSALSQAESRAPSAIKGDFHTFVTAFAPILQLLANANYDYTKITPSDYATFASMDTPQIKAATSHIEQYVTQVCHVSTTPNS